MSGTDVATRAHTRAMELAFRQLPDGEIAGTLRRELGMTHDEALIMLDGMATELMSERKAGQGYMRERWWLLADGDPTLAKLNGAQMRGMEVVAKAYCGMDSYDEAVRKAIEKAQRDAAKGRKLRAV